MSEGKPLSETLTDAQIASLLRESDLEDTAPNIDLVRNTRKKIEKAVEELHRGKPLAKILKEAEIDGLKKN